LKLLRDFVLYLLYCAAATLIAMAMAFLWRQFLMQERHGQALPGRTLETPIRNASPAPR
jgi:hypothetical protein